VRILVTGGAGFIGSNVADRFVALGHEVAVLDDLSSGFREFVPPRARFYNADVSDAAAIERCFAEFRPEIVDHHAAQIDVRRSVSDPVYDATINILGGLRLLEACTRHGVRKFVYASTGGALYGEGRRLPAAEDHPVNPEAPYGASKHTVEHYLYIWRLLRGLDYTVLRYPNVYGPRQAASLEGGVVAIFLERMAAAEPVTIFGDGRQTRDFVYVGDVVRAVLAAPGHGGGVLNVGTGSETSVNELYAACSRTTGSTAAPQYAPARPGDVIRSVIDPGRAERELGFRAETTLAAGLAATWDWVRSGKD